MLNKYFKELDSQVLNNDQFCTSTLILSTHIKMRKDALSGEKAAQYEADINNPELDENKVRLAEIKLQSLNSLTQKEKTKNDFESFLSFCETMPCFSNFNIENENDYELFLAALNDYKAYALNRFFIDNDYFLSPKKLLSINLGIDFDRKIETLEFQGYSKLLEDTGYNEVQLYEFILAHKYNNNHHSNKLIIPAPKGNYELTYDKLSNSLVEELYCNKNKYSVIHYLIVNQFTPDYALFTYKRHLSFYEANDLIELEASSSTDPLIQKLTKEDILSFIEELEKFQVEYNQRYSQNEAQCVFNEVMFSEGKLKSTSLNNLMTFHFELKLNKNKLDVLSESFNLFSFYKEQQKEDICNLFIDFYEKTLIEKIFINKEYEWEYLFNIFLYPNSYVGMLKESNILNDDFLTLEELKNKGFDMNLINDYSENKKILFPNTNYQTKI